MHVRTINIYASSLFNNIFCGWVGLAGMNERIFMQMIAIRIFLPSFLPSKYVVYLRMDFNDVYCTRIVIQKEF